MQRILVTGMSGTGKSSALAELARRGFRTVDTDDPGWTFEDAEGSRWWDEAPIARLLSEAGPTLYVSGTVTNQGRFYDHFDAVVLLSAPAEVLLERIATRTTNDYGKTSFERKVILAQIGAVEPLLRATCTHEIDVTLPLAEVVDSLVGWALRARVKACPTSGRPTPSCRTRRSSSGSTRRSPRLPPPKASRSRSSKSSSPTPRDSSSSGSTPNPGSGW